MRADFTVRVAHRPRGSITRVSVVASLHWDSPMDRQQRSLVCEYQLDVTSGIALDPYALKIDEVKQ